MLDLR